MADPPPHQGARGDRIPRHMPELSGGAELKSGRLSFTKIGASRYDLSDPYHLALTVNWATFIGGVVVALILMNLLFAALYSLIPNAIFNAHAGSFQDAFFFSVETLATVGYGEMYPGNDYAHWVAIVEIFTGMAFTAIVTGLFFVRFSKPRAKLCYADHLVVTRYNGVPTLMARVGNARMNILTDTTVRLHVLIRETSAEGHVLRRSQELTMPRTRFAVFALTLTLLHVIDDNSPLHGLTVEDLQRDRVRFFLTVEARDPALGAAVHDMYVYDADDLKFGMRFVDAVSVDEFGHASADLRRISDLELDPPAI